MAGKVVGIDLGTTKSVVAHVDEHGRVDVVPNAESDRLTPSVVLFEAKGEGGHEAIVGKLAKASAISDGDRVVQFVKREMGRPGASFEFDGVTYTPEEISALILRKLKADAERRLMAPVTGAVITVPAYFNDAQRKATEDAGRIAGLDVLSILNEPTAAALAHGLLGRAGTPGVGIGRTTLVFDLGGGTFDITLMRTLPDGGVRMFATDGDDRLGGKDWDDRLITHVAAEFEKAHGANPLEDLTAYQDLAGKCEEAKIALSRKERVKIAASHGGLFHAVEATREAFEEMTADLVARLEAKVAIVLEDAGVAWREVGLVLLVGGATRMPMVRRMLERVARGVEVAEAASPDEAVALGAAIQAELLAARRDGTEPAPIGGREGKDLAGIELGHVNAHSLGVVARVHGEFANCVLIPRNSPIPCAKRGRFQTIHDDQTRIEVIVLEGEESDPESCATIGTCVISGLPPRPRGAPVTIEYSYDARGRIHVRAVDQESGREATTTIERPAGLTQDGVDAAEERLAATAVS